MPVVDASVVVAILAPDTGSAEADLQRLWRAWSESGERLWAPPLLHLEVRNALLTGIRRQRWDGAAADEACALAAAVPVLIEESEQDRARAWELARRYDNWPIYHMTYVALAERLETSLVTLDERLVRRFAATPGRVVAPSVR